MITWLDYDSPNDCLTALGSRELSDQAEQHAEHDPALQLTHRLGAE